MKAGTIIGIALLILALGAIFYGLNYATGKIGKAIETGERSGYITPCQTDADCPSSQRCELEHCRTT